MTNKKLTTPTTTRRRLSRSSRLLGDAVRAEVPPASAGAVADQPWRNRGRQTPGKKRR